MLFLLICLFAREDFLLQSKTIVNHDFEFAKCIKATIKEQILAFDLKIPHTKERI